MDHNKPSRLSDTLRQWFAPNRRDSQAGPASASLEQHIAQRRSQVSEHAYGLLLIQIKTFQPLADSYGLGWCETLLDQFGRRLQALLGEHDQLLSLGDGRLLIYCEAASPSRSSELAERVMQTVNSPIDCDGLQITLDLRMGIALSPDDDQAPLALLQKAALALASTGPGVDALARYNNDLEQQRSHRLTLTQRLQQAISDNALSLHYQPTLDLQRNQVTQVESLLRWTDPVLGAVAPSDFVALAELSGDILALGDWALTEAARQAKEWRDTGMAVRIGVNVAGRDFQRPDFAERVLNAISTTGAKPGDLVLDITESATIDDLLLARQHMQRLRDAGVGLAIDDFGSGYSSLTVLKQLPAHALKIDKSFIIDVDRDSTHHKIVRATIELGHNLGLSVIATGVESHTSLQLLRQLDCDAIQGYHLCPPLEANAFEAWWSQRELHISDAVRAEPGIFN